MAETQADFNIHRALAQYVGVTVHPDIFAAVQFIAQCNKPTDENEFKMLNDSVKFLK